MINKKGILITAIVDFVGGVIALMVGQFFPEQAEFAGQLWGYCQVLAGAFILYYFADGANAIIARLK